MTFCAACGTMLGPELTFWQRQGLTLSFVGDSQLSLAFWAVAFHFRESLFGQPLHP